MSGRFKRYTIYFLFIGQILLQHRVRGQNNSRVDDLTVLHDIEYKRFFDSSGNAVALKLDIYRGKELRQGRPAIILVHGGGFWEGDKASELYVKIAKAFAMRGYVSFSINYTLKGKGFIYSRRVLDTCISDVMAAVRWIRANSDRFGVDSLKLFISGDSAGGGIAVNTSYDTLYSSYFIGCIDLWGGLPGSRAWEAPIFSGEFAPRIPATCLIHGTADKIVPYYVSQHLSRELSRINVYHELHPLKNADHYPVQLAAYFIPLMVEFADKIDKGVQ